MTHGASTPGTHRRKLLSGWRLRATVATLAALSVYAAVGFLVVPWIVRSQIETQARRVLHREATVARVRFNPFTFAGVVEGFELKDRDGADFFKLARLAVNIQLRGLFFRRTWQFRDVIIERPEAVVRIMADGRLSIADLFEAGTAERPQQEEGSLSRLSIGRFAIMGGRLEFLDESRTPRFVENLAPLDLEVHELTTIPEESGDLIGDTRDVIPFRRMP